jgi:hypothetical protein
VAGGDDAIAQSDITDLNGLEQIWEKGRHSGVTRR